MATSNVTNMTAENGTATTIVWYAPTMITTNGIWQGDNPLDYSLPLFIAQLTLVVVTTRILVLLFKPFRQPRVIAEIMGGVILGPSVLGQNKTFADTFFPMRSVMVIETMANVGLLYFLFLVGLEMDIAVIRRMGKQAIVIAVARMILPFAVGAAFSFLIHEEAHVLNHGTFILFLGIALSVTAFPVLARILSELKLANTELGRIALSSALVNDMCPWVLLALAIAVEENDSTSLASLYVILSSIAFVCFCIFIVRPAMCWLIRRTPEGEAFSEFHICLILTGVMISGFITDAIGTHSVFGAFVFGLVIPNGPLGVTLIEKLEDFVSGLLLPLFFAISGLRTNITSIQEAGTWGLLILVIVLACIGKIAGTVVVCLFYQMPIDEGFTLGLLMNTKGLVELIILNVGKDQAQEDQIQAQEDQGQAQEDQGKYQEDQGKAQEDQCHMLGASSSPQTRQVVVVEEEEEDVENVSLGQRKRSLQMRSPQLLLWLKVPNAKKARVIGQDAGPLMVPKRSQQKAVSSNTIVVASGQASEGGETVVEKALRTQVPASTYVPDSSLREAEAGVPDVPLKDSINIRIPKVATPSSLKIYNEFVEGFLMGKSVPRTPVEKAVAMGVWSTEVMLEAINAARSEEKQQEGARVSLCEHEAMMANAELTIADLRDKLGKAEEKADDWSLQNGLLNSSKAEAEARMPRLEGDLGVATDACRKFEALLRLEQSRLKAEKEGHHRAFSEAFRAKEVAEVALVDYQADRVRLDRRIESLEGQVVSLRQEVGNAEASAIKRHLSSAANIDEQLKLVETSYLAGASYVGTGLARVGLIPKGSFEEAVSAGKIAPDPWLETRLNEVGGLLCDWKAETSSGGEDLVGEGGVVEPSIDAVASSL